MKKSHRRLLGIDPGTRNAGWGVIEAHGTTLRLVACGVLRASAKADISRRLETIFAGYETLIIQHEPVAAALEETFSGVNPKSAIAMGEGRGVALLALARGSVPVLELSPSEIKKAVTGNGAAGKDLVARMVCARLGLAAAPEPQDVTDALAAAIALAHRMPRI
ncbi:MAG: crossover junction endodeoxyribonuclease RuvC [Planctomycetes bacterium]|nr:crossover junction endodeoxyribonuclease RuvC [Planctomycetota bacterium]